MHRHRSLATVHFAVKFAVLQASVLASFISAAPGAQVSRLWATGLGQLPVWGNCWPFSSVPEAVHLLVLCSAVAPRALAPCLACPACVVPCVRRASQVHRVSLPRACCLVLCICVCDVGFVAPRVRIARRAFAPHAPSCLVPSRFADQPSAELASPRRVLVRSAALL